MRAAGVAQRPVGRSGDGNSAADREQAVVPLRERRRSRRDARRQGRPRLARRPEEISIADIVGAIDGPIALTQCIERGPGHCELEALCLSRMGWQVLNRSVRRAFEDVSLAHLLTPALVPGACAPRRGPRASRRTFLG